MSKRWSDDVLDQVVIQWWPSDLGGDPAIHIELFEVPDHLRGQGIGTAAYKRFERDARKSGVKFIELYAQESMDFWESVGFMLDDEESEYDLPDGYMVKYIGGKG